MTEYNIFCYSKICNNDKWFQQKRYRAFNKEVGEKRYKEIVKEVSTILGSPKMKLSDFWKQVTQEQWIQLLDIPEAKDFKEGVKLGEDIIDSGKAKAKLEDLIKFTNSL